MSTRDDARLTAEERAALSNLEALAMADDPQLAARLRGPGRWHPINALARLKLITRWARIPSWFYELWFCIAAVVVGLALAVLSPAVGLAVGLVGSLLTAGGLVLLLRVVPRRIAGDRVGDTA